MGFIGTFWADRYRLYKRLIAKYPRLIAAGLFVYNHLNIHNRLRCRNNQLKCGSALLSNVKLSISGKNNTIEIDDYCRLYNCRIIIQGNNNSIRIGEYAYLNDIELYFEDDKNCIEIGKHSSLCGKAHFAAIESTKITIGDNCLFSSDLHFRTGDSHSVIDEKGQRINPSKDIYIGNHVWVGTKVTCLKNVYVPDNCIIAATSTLCGQFKESGCIIGGVPAKIIKKNINWDNTRL